MNWGVKIFAVYGLFVVFILTMVFRSCEYKVELVTDEYYAEELKYGDKMEKIKRTNQLAEGITWEVTSEKLSINYPGEQDLSGKVMLMRPSKKDWDLEVSVTPDANGLQEIPGEALHPGWYHLKIEWAQGGEEYFSEGRIFVPYPEDHKS